MAALSELSPITPAYRKIIDRLTRESSKLQIDGALEIRIGSHILGLLANPTRTISIGSARLYKAALDAYVRSDHAQKDCQATMTELMSAIEMSISNMSPDSQRAATFTNREMGIEPEAFQLVTSTLIVNRSAWASLAARWMAAGIVTGMRPGEWETAHLPTWDQEAAQNGLLCVSTVTLKQRGDERRSTLPISNIESYRVVEYFIAAYRAARRDATAEELLRQCSRQVAAVSKRIWPNDTSHRYTLYVTRHQAAANARYDTALSTVASQLGHTARQNKSYGKLAIAWPQQA